MIQRTGVGMDCMDAQALTARGIPVYVNAGVNAVSVAEHTVLLLLSVLRRMTEIDAQMHEGIWKKQENGIHFGVEQIDLLCDMKSLDTAQKKVNGEGKKQEPAKQLKIMKNFFLNMQIRCPLIITILSI